MTDLPTWALEEAVKRLNAEPGHRRWLSPNNHLHPIVTAFARTIVKHEKEPDDPAKGIDRPSAFCPVDVMLEPFRAFLDAAEACANKGFMVFMRPDKSENTTYLQQLFILPESALVAGRRGIEMAGGL